MLTYVTYVSLLKREEISNHGSHLPLSGSERGARAGTASSVGWLGSMMTSTFCLILWQRVSTLRTSHSALGVLSLFGARRAERIL